MAKDNGNFLDDFKGLTFEATKTEEIKEKKKPAKKEKEDVKVNVEPEKKPEEKPEVMVEENINLGCVVPLNDIHKKTVKKMFIVTPYIADGLKEVSEKSGLSMNEVVNQVLKNYIDSL